MWDREGKQMCPRVSLYVSTVVTIDVTQWVSQCQRVPHGAIMCLEMSQWTQAVTVGPRMSQWTPGCHSGPQGVKMCARVSQFLQRCHEEWNPLTKYTVKQLPYNNTFMYKQTNHSSDTNYYIHKLSLTHKEIFHTYSMLLSTLCWTKHKANI